MSKKHRRLYQHEAEILGLQVKENLKNRQQAQYYISDEDYKIIQDLRFTPKHKLFVEAKNKGILEACENVGVQPDHAPMIWLKTKDESVRVDNPFYVKKEVKALQEYIKDLTLQLKKYSPDFKKIKREEQEDPHLFIIDIADLHINKYCDIDLTGANYNSAIAVQRAVDGTRGLIKKASGFNLEKILFVIGNDVLNTDNLLKGTTKGTLQDTDTHWLRAFNIAKECYIKCIEICVGVCDVDIVHCTSNHDFMSGCFLAETLHAWFRNCKNITFNIGAKYRKYYKYHSNMIGLEHGEKGKMANLPLLMAQEEPQMWASTKFRYSYLHHVHHQDKTQFKSSKDYIGANVTYLRSPSSADIWHSDNQYINLIAVEGFIHSMHNGRVSHLTHYF
jgi:hypothetical protein